MRGAERFEPLPCFLLTPISFTFSSSQKLSLSFTFLLPSQCLDGFQTGRAVGRQHPEENPDRGADPVDEQDYALGWATCAGFSEILGRSIETPTPSPTPESPPRGGDKHRPRKETGAGCPNRRRPMALRAPISRVRSATGVSHYVHDADAAHQQRDACDAREQVG